MTIGTTFASPNIVECMNRHVLCVHNAHDYPTASVTDEESVAADTCKGGEGMGVPGGCGGVPCWDMGDPRLASLPPLG